jgi:hypothetical protein
MKLRFKRLVSQRSSRNQLIRQLKNKRKKMLLLLPLLLMVPK